MQEEQSQKERSIEHVGADQVVQRGLLPRLLVELRSWYQLAEDKKDSYKNRPSEDPQQVAAEAMFWKLDDLLDDLAEELQPALFKQLQAFVKQRTEIPALPERFAIQPMPQEGDEARATEKTKRDDLRLIDREIEDRLALVFRHDDKRERAIARLERGKLRADPEDLARYQDLDDSPDIQTIREKNIRLGEIDRLLNSPTLSAEQRTELVQEREQLRDELDGFRQGPDSAEFRTLASKVQKAPHIAKGGEDPAFIDSARLIALRKAASYEPVRRAEHREQYRSWWEKQPDREAIEAHIDARVRAVAAEHLLANALTKDDRDNVQAGAVVDACQEAGIMHHLLLSPNDPLPKTLRKVLGIDVPVYRMQKVAKELVEELEGIQAQFGRDARLATIEGDITRRLETLREKSKSFDHNELRATSDELRSWIKVTRRLETHHTMVAQLQEFAADAANSSLKVTADIKELLDSETVYAAANELKGAAKRLQKMVYRATAATEARQQLPELIRDLQAYLESGAANDSPELRQRVTEALDGLGPEKIGGLTDPTKTAVDLTELARDVANQQNIPLENQALYERLESFCRQHEGDSGPELEQLRQILATASPKGAHTVREHNHRNIDLRTARRLIWGHRRLRDRIQENFTTLRTLGQGGNVPDDFAGKMQQVAAYYEPVASSKDWEQLEELDRVLQGYVEQVRTAETVHREQDAAFEQGITLLEQYKTLRNKHGDEFQMTLSTSAEEADRAIQEFKGKWRELPEGPGSTAEKRMQVLKGLSDTVSLLESKLEVLSYSAPRYGTSISYTPAKEKIRACTDHLLGYQNILDPNRPQPKAEGNFSWFINLGRAIRRAWQVWTGSAVAIEVKLPLIQARQDCLAAAAEEEEAVRTEVAEVLGGLVSAVQARHSEGENGLLTAAAGGSCGTVRHTGTMASVLSTSGQSGPGLPVIPEAGEDDHDEDADDAAPVPATQLQGEQPGQQQDRIVETGRHEPPPVEGRRSFFGSG